MKKLILIAFLMVPWAVHAQEADKFVPPSICATIVNKMMESKTIEVSIPAYRKGEATAVGYRRNEIERQKMLMELFRDHNCDTNMLNKYIEGF